MPVKKKPNFGKTCQVCQTAYSTEDEVYMDTLDNGATWIICKNEACYKQQGGRAIESKDSKPRFTPTKFPIQDFPKLVNMAELQLESFLKKRKTEYENNPAELAAGEVNMWTLLSVAEQAMFIESMVRSMVTGCKPQMTNYSNCIVHDLDPDEYTFGEHGQKVYVCQKCYAEVEEYRRKLD